MSPSATSLAAETKRGGARSDFRPAFDVLDADHDGKISKDDLRMFYAGFSRNDADDDVIGSMMSVADFNKDGFVEYDEFERVLDGFSENKESSISTRSTSGVMEDVFKVMDKDGDGKLSVEDLKSYMQWAGFDAPDDDIKAMIKLAGCAAGGDEDVVTYDGLLKILALDNSHVA
jgi:calmodulin